MQLPLIIKRFRPELAVARSDQVFLNDFPQRSYFVTDLSRNLALPIRKPLLGGKMLDLVFATPEKFYKCL
jgi:hypothetical protein